MQNILEVSCDIEKGHFTQRINANPVNPKLVELKEVLNKMLDDIQMKIGKDLNEIERVFASFQNLDFSDKLDNAEGEIEKSLNTVGAEIRKMLQASLSQGEMLQTKADSLQESSAAVEEMSAFMNAVAARTQKSLGEIEANTNILVQSINEMGESIKEQALGISQINQSISVIDGLTKENSQIAHATNSVANEVDSMSADIVAEVRRKKF
ncbi:methyl-accepting chemotaxis protein [Campylobacter lari]|uniref:Methyl-accepting chemotaxis protein n=1 Tax=Campylobacter lari TaxID=201 RepID=A0A698FUR0_CAMLA|nr:methyl-accepting chemotaxis protein [Campylobacter lari]MBT0794511.1 methyl-accepting chemotaxis protein [Campylobacter lari]